ncbi:UDP-glucose 6-dehydrogenase [Candidatus Omnitrophus magneticus]|uniref:UDP-glucose 6-dehydrogenase n=1 Tax=Candidatus Omnitrophus magneticus TaxID=1609969 RepID=A0A0F0CW21_9BACT|nr:UDP-glucose 6-dehydrogenase [Candidatus Omnitrophus magneticus]
MKVSIIGAGYVGLVTGACLAELGNEVLCVDRNVSKIEILNSGSVPIYEPGLEELIQKNSGKKRLSFTVSIEEGVRFADVIFICVGTPPRDDGSADLTAIEEVSDIIAECMDSYKLVVEKSTVPVETGEWVKKTIEKFKRNSAEFDIASNPEFLREGSAIEDFMNPDRIVIGVESLKAETILRELYRPLDAKIVVTNTKGAEIIKHSANSFLAMKISFINALSNICEKTGADINEVAEGIGLDKRINPYFLKAGIGFGGSCFPKDVKAFIHICEKLGYPFNLLKEVEKINEYQKENAFIKLREMLWNIPGKIIAVWGLAFKPNTDDIRSSPSIDIIKKLLKEGAKIKVFDPAAMEKAKEELGDSVIYCNDTYTSATGSDCIVLMTEWNEFKEIDWNRIKKIVRQPVVLDGRNIYDPVKLKNMGFEYRGMGRR